MNLKEHWENVKSQKMCPWENEITNIDRTTEEKKET